MTGMETVNKNDIFFVLDDFSSGGAARVISLIASELAQRGYSVNIILDKNRPIFYPLHSGIRIIPLYEKRSPRNLFEQIFFSVKRLRKLIKENDGVWISVMPDMSLALWLASLFKRVKKIASDHTSFERKLSVYGKFNRSFVYSRFDAVTVLTQRDYVFLGKKLPRKVVMPNPIKIERHVSNSERANIVLAAGRLDVWKLKGFDILLNAWSRIAANNPDWKLQIAGDGSQKSRDEVKALICQLEIADSVDLLGQVSDIKSVMSRASIFAMTSRVEGFGLVLVEAMSQGCACISFDDGGRQSEIIDCGSGIIIDDNSEEQLADTIQKLIDDADLRLKLSEGAVRRAGDYDVKKIADKWETLLKTL